MFMNAGEREKYFEMRVQTLFADQDVRWTEQLDRVEDKIDNLGQELEDKFDVLNKNFTGLVGIMGMHTRVMLDSQKEAQNAAARAQNRRIFRLHGFITPIFVKMETKDVHEPKWEYPVNLPQTLWELYELGQTAKGFDMRTWPAEELQAALGMSFFSSIEGTLQKHHSSS